MADSTTFIFVPGAWHSPHCFDRVITELEASGHNTERVFTVSVSDEKANPDESADVAVIRGSIVQAVESGQKVVVVCHSYGGIPTTEAITEDLSASARQAQGKPGGIINLVYCCAFLLQQGQRLSDVSKGPQPEDFEMVNGLLTLANPGAAERLFYSDMPQEDVKQAIAMLKGQSPAPVGMPITNTGWKYVPCTYIYCTLDNAIPFDDQKRMVDAALKEGGNFGTETLECSHSPFYSQPVEMAQVLRRSAGEIW